ncbi:MAG TPA: His/Gly/Thr/Pro-type tRNA ligase C-terminal domain-containing protein, partial [Terriglobia bacterium]|nr:His/Gly/Thr/Pro-type tRNA ligase C-terminal domain-containing protein [Terriglobia bacterium]HEV2499605.1 His/Gly/Thr/Pro-type tRNA ligase C-terminal domain-containing protein [Terriglobia bacterium]
VPALDLARELRAAGLRVEIGLEPVKLKKMLGQANKLQARFAVIIGEGELARGRYQVKDMQAATQEEVEPGGIMEYLKSRL